MAAQFLSITAPQPEKPDGRSWVERRAVEIDDPVERLRYLRRAMDPPPEVSAARSRRRGSATLTLLIVPLLVGLTPTRVRSHEPPPPAPVVHADLVQLSHEAVHEIANVWRVEASKTAEVFSNGLRVELAYTTPNRARSRFPIYELEGGGAKEWGEAPVGIVYHTTESHLAPFEEEATRRLKQLGQNLLSVLRHEHSYHYLIDRFGRVFRVVEESQAAFHAGFSVWADAAGVYVNLNDSFLGVAFEGQTGAIEEMTPAQIVSAKMLTDMLRARYRIDAGNCVTHAQVSVSPENMRIAAHTDWAGRFPFTELGLPNNYDVPLPSVYLFGFGYDAAFVKSAGMTWKGLALADEKIREGAAGAGSNVARYRAGLQRRFRGIVSEIKKHSQGDTE